MQINSNTILLFTSPLILSLILLEFFWARRKGLAIYSVKDSLTNILSIILHQYSLVVFATVNIYGVITIYSFLYTHGLRWASTQWTWSGVLALLVLQDFLYYWLHRLSHRVRWLWSGHVVHHSSTYMNLTTSFRHSFLYPVTGVRLAWVPLGLLGFPGYQVTTVIAISLCMQILSHTQAVGRLGLLEWILVTPSHHRVHHGRNPQYLDKNFGGIFILWDRLFGTFEQEEEVPQFGLRENLKSQSLWNVHLGEFLQMLLQFVRVRSLKEKWQTLFGPPEWRPGGRD